MQYRDKNYTDRIGSVLDSIEIRYVKAGWYSTAPRRSVIPKQISKICEGVLNRFIFTIKPYKTAEFASRVKRFSSMFKLTDAKWFNLAGSDSDLRQVLFIFSSSSLISLVRHVLWCKILLSVLSVAISYYRDGKSLSSSSSSVLYSLYLFRWNGLYVPTVLRKSIKRAVMR